MAIHWIKYLPPWPRTVWDEGKCWVECCKRKADTINTAAKTTIHQVTIMLATSRSVLLPGHNHLLITGTDDLTLWLSKRRDISTCAYSRWLLQNHFKVISMGNNVHKQVFEKRANWTSGPKLKSRLIQWISFFLHIYCNDKSLQCPSMWPFGRWYHSDRFDLIFH